jgi:hypothetical protein
MFIGAMRELGWSYLASSLSGLGENPQGFSGPKQGSEPVRQRWAVRVGRSDQLAFRDRDTQEAVTNVSDKWYGIRC